jgi:hypothetical protein
VVGFCNNVNALPARMVSRSGASDGTGAFVGREDSVGGWDLHRNLIPGRRKGRAIFQTSMAELRHPFFWVQRSNTGLWAWERGDGDEIDHLVILCRVPLS